MNWIGIFFADASDIYFFFFIRFSLLKMLFTKFIYNWSNILRFLIFFQALEMIKILQIHNLFSLFFLNLKIFSLKSIKTDSNIEKKKLFLTLMYFNRCCILMMFGYLFGELYRKSYKNHVEKECIKICQYVCITIIALLMVRLLSLFYYYYFVIYIHWS